MLKNAYLLANIGADAVENEQLLPKFMKKSDMTTIPAVLCASRARGAGGVPLVRRGGQVRRGPVVDLRTRSRRAEATSALLACRKRFSFKGERNMIGTVGELLTL